MSQDFATKAPQGAYQKNNYLLPMINANSAEGGSRDYLPVNGQLNNNNNDILAAQKFDNFDLDVAMTNFENYYPQINEGNMRSQNLDL